MLHKQEMFLKGIDLIGINLTQLCKRTQDVQYQNTNACPNVSQCDLQGQFWRSAARVNYTIPNKKVSIHI